MKNKEDYIHTTISIGVKLGKSKEYVRKVAINLGLNPMLINRSLHFTDEQVKQIAKYNPKGRNYYNSKKYSKVKINIIDFFLTHKNNTTAEIAKCMSLDLHYVNLVVNEYLNNNNTITVVSKL